MILVFLWAFETFMGRVHVLSWEHLLGKTAWSHLSHSDTSSAKRRHGQSPVTQGKGHWQSTSAKFCAIKRESGSCFFLLLLFLFFFFFFVETQNWVSRYLEKVCFLCDVIYDSLKSSQILMRYGKALCGYRRFSRLPRHQLVLLESQPELIQGVRMCMHGICYSWDLACTL